MTCIHNFQDIFNVCLRISQQKLPCKILYAWFTPWSHHSAFVTPPSPRKQLQVNCVHWVLYCLRTDWWIYVVWVIGVMRLSLEQIRIKQVISSCCRLCWKYSILRPSYCQSHSVNNMSWLVCAENWCVGRSPGFLLILTVWRYFSGIARIRDHPYCWPPLRHQPVGEQ